jgi:hypothetical protein
MVIKKKLHGLSPRANYTYRATHHGDKARKISETGYIAHVGGKWEPTTIILVRKSDSKTVKRDSNTKMNFTDLEILDRNQFSQLLGGFCEHKIELRMTGVLNFVRCSEY